MMSHIDSHSEFASLLSGLIEDRLAPSQFEQLGKILETDAAARAIYRDHLSMHAMLHWRWHQEAPDEQRTSTGEGIGRTARAGLPPPHSDSRPSSLPPIVQLPIAPVPAFLSTTLHGTVGYFSSGWPVAYLVATVVFAIGALVGSLVHVSQPAQVAEQSASLPLLCPLSPPWSVESPGWSIVSGRRGRGTGDERRGLQVDNLVSRWARSSPWRPAWWKLPMTLGQKLSSRVPLRMKWNQGTVGFYPLAS